MLYAVPRGRCAVGQFVVLRCLAACRSKSVQMFVVLYKKGSTWLSDAAAVLGKTS